MKTGTTCTRCANASICPKFDSHTLYGFCCGFETRRKCKKMRSASALICLVMFSFVFVKKGIDCCWGIKHNAKLTRRTRTLLEW